MLLLLAGTSRGACAQHPDSVGSHSVVTGAITLTNNGISVIPSFTLGKPAGILDVSVAKRGLSFDPQFRFGLDGKPWSILLWGRYRVHDGRKVQVHVGAHPALVFRTVTETLGGGGTREWLAARRYFTTEVAADYVVARDVRVGAYYLQSYGIERDAARHTHFVAARSTIANLHRGPYTLVLAPQAYYLQLDAAHGTYVNGAVTLLRRHLPLSVGASINQTLQSDIAQPHDMVWNVSVIYAFR